MTNEIKEIIEYLKDDSMFISDENGTRKEITLDESKLLLDYITNLQEKLNRIDKLINIDYGCVSYYFKYNNRYLKSEIKGDINNILRGDE